MNRALSACIRSGGPVDDTLHDARYAAQPFVPGLQLQAVHPRRAPGDTELLCSPWPLTVVECGRSLSAARPPCALYVFWFLVLVLVLALVISFPMQICAWRRLTALDWYFSTCFVVLFVCFWWILSSLTAPSEPVKIRRCRRFHEWRAIGGGRTESMWAVLGRPGGKGASLFYFIFFFFFCDGDCSQPIHTDTTLTHPPHISHACNKHACYFLAGWRDAAILSPPASP
jgi:hypothetical protein